MEFQVDGEWLDKPEADRRMMHQALERIVRLAGGPRAWEHLPPDVRDIFAAIGEIANDTLGFVGELASVSAKGHGDG